MSDDLIAGVDYERSSCPNCGDPDCTFPPECQDAIGVWPEPTPDDRPTMKPTGMNFLTWDPTETTENIVRRIERKNR